MKTKIHNLMSLALAGIGLGLLVLQAGPAQAVPSYARQTGEECAACHVGAFGPQLTPHGMQFKLGGYTESDGQGRKIPLSAMLEGTFSHAAKDPDPSDSGSNDKWALQEASAFLAGRWTNSVGSFIQATTSSDADGKVSLDNAEIRFARPVQLADKDAVVGLSFNNNPTLSDPFNTLPGWRFPFTGPELVEPMASPLIDGGLEQQVAGLTAYGLWNDSVYAEVGAYRSLSQSLMDSLNIESGDKIDGMAPYWRLAYTQDRHKDAWSVGVFGIKADILPGFEPGPSDKHLDLGLDASYQFLGNRKNIFTLNTSYIHERNTLDASDPGHEVNLNRFDLSGSYYYNQTYGLTLGLFDINGTANSILYEDTGDGAGSANNKPDTRGYILQADWTPFGKEENLDKTWANLRLGLQYTGYTKFNGASSNYDSSGRDASDNNTLFAFLWTAF